MQQFGGISRPSKTPNKSRQSPSRRYSPVAKEDRTEDKTETGMNHDSKKQEAVKAVGFLKKMILDFMKEPLIQSESMMASVRFKVDDTTPNIVYFTDSPEYCFRSIRLATKFSEHWKRLADNSKRESVLYILTEFKVLWIWNDSHNPNNGGFVDFDCETLSISGNVSHDPRNAHFKTKPFQDTAEFMRLISDKIVKLNKQSHLEAAKKEITRGHNRAIKNKVYSTPGPALGGESRTLGIFSLKVGMENLQHNQQKQVVPEQANLSQSESLAAKAAEIDKRKLAAVEHHTKPLASTTMGGAEILYARIEQKSVDKSGTLIRNDLVPQSSEVVTDTKIRNVFATATNMNENNGESGPGCRNLLVKLKQEMTDFNRVDIITNDEFEPNFLVEMNKPQNKDQSSTSIIVADESSINPPVSIFSPRRAKQIFASQESSKSSDSKSLKIPTKPKESGLLRTKSPLKKIASSQTKAISESNQRGTLITRLGKRKPPFGSDADSDGLDENSENLVTTDLSNAPQNDTEATVAVSIQPKISPKARTTVIKMDLAVLEQSLNKDLNILDPKPSAAESVSKRAIQDALAAVGKENANSISNLPSAQNLGLSASSSAVLNPLKVQILPLPKTAETSTQNSAIQKTPSSQPLKLFDGYEKVQNRNQLSKPKAPQRRAQSRAQGQIKESSEPTIQKPTETTLPRAFTLRERQTTGHGKQLEGDLKPEKAQNSENIIQPEIPIRLRGKSLGPKTQMRSQQEEVRIKVPRNSRSRAPEVPKPEVPGETTGVKTRAGKRNSVENKYWDGGEINLQSIQPTPPAKLRWLTETGWTQPMDALPGEKPPLRQQETPAGQSTSAVEAANPKPSELSTATPEPATQSGTKLHEFPLKPESTVGTQQEPPQESSSSRTLADWLKEVPASPNVVVKTPAATQTPPMVKLDKTTEFNCSSDEFAAFCAQQQPNPRVEELEQLLVALQSKYQSLEEQKRQLEVTLAEERRLVSTLTTTVQIYQEDVKRLREENASLKSSAQQQLGSRRTESDLAGKSSYVKMSDSRPMMAFTQLPRGDSERKGRGFHSSPSPSSAGEGSMPLRREDNRFIQRRDSLDHSVPAVNDRSISSNVSSTQFHLLNLADNGKAVGTAKQMPDSQNFARDMSEDFSLSNPLPSDSKKGVKLAGGLGSAVSEGPDSHVGRPVSAKMLSNRNPVVANSPTQVFSRFAPEGPPLAKRTAPPASSDKNLNGISDFVTLAAKGLGTSLPGTAIPPHTHTGYRFPRTEFPQGGPPPKERASYAGPH